MLKDIIQVGAQPITKEIGAWIIEIDGVRVKMPSGKGCWLKKSGALNALHRCIQTTSYKNKLKYHSAREYKKEFDELIDAGFIKVINLLEK